MLRVLPPLVLVLVSALLAMPTTASAAPEWWTAENETCGGFNGTERGSGQMDSVGRLYVPCSQSRDAQTGALRHDNYIAILNAAGQQVGKVPLDFTPDDGQGYTDRASDVAPSPDGSFLYVIHYTSYSVYRFDRQPDGTYRARTQAEWSLATFPWHGGGGANLPRGQFLATDGNGDIYLSAGLWTCQAGSPHCTDDAIVKYTAAGTYVTRFGRKVGGSWALGTSAGSFGGVSVTADGRRVFVTDINNSRVQRFDRAGDGTYGAVLAMGMNEQNDPNRWGACYGDGVLAAPYDVAMSAGGELVVINTSCYNDGRYAAYPVATIEVQRFGQDGSSRGSVLSRSLGDNRVHGIAVDRSGNVHLLQAKTVLRPAAGWSDAGADAGGGGPLGGTAAVDLTAPTITMISVPPTTQGRDITIGITATDASGVTELRVREDGVHGAWRAYATSIPHVLTERLGAHELVVEVRDAAGNAASVTVTVTRESPPAPPTQPTQPTNPKPADPVQPKPADPVQPKPAEPVQPKPADPVQPKPADPAQPGGGTVQGGGGTPAERPDITSVSMPVQLTRGTHIKVSLRAAGIGGVTHVRFSTAGTRWGRWRPMSAVGSVALPKGAGWKGVFVQVKDGAGTTSVPWFQPVLMGPRGVGWFKGTRGADKVRLKGGAQHVDLSNFDRKVDRVSCGAGFDTVLLQPEDVAAKDCEVVNRVKMPAWS